MNSRSRNYRFGWTNSIHTPPGERHWRFAEFGPSTGPLGASGIADEFYRIARLNQSHYWTCAVWQGSELIARGHSAVRDLIHSYEEERELVAYQRKQR